MYQVLVQANLSLILLVLAVSLIILSKSADLLVNHAVSLSKLLGLSELIIGATIVSLGTTLPELSASVVSALQGNGGFALGNAVGSIIANTSLILGIGALFGSIPVDKKTSQKITILLIGSVLLVLPAVFYQIGRENGRIPQWMGFIFLLLLVAYMYFLVRQEHSKNSSEHTKQVKNVKSIFILILKIFLSALLIAGSASVLVSSAEILAERIGIPDVVISATLVAFGTSVPELSTCITAAKSRHGGLAIGNIIGADILNILFVVGVSAALTKGGIVVTQSFYRIHFIGLAAVLTVFGFFAYNTKIDEINKKEGILLILLYSIYLAANLIIR